MQAAIGGAAGRDLRHKVLRVQYQAQRALASGYGYAELLLGRRRAGIAPARACTGCFRDCTRTGRLPAAALLIKRRAISG